MNTSASERLANDAFNRAEAAVASIMESIGPPTSSAAYSGVPFEPNRWSSEGVGGASSSASTIPLPLSPIGTAEMLLSAQRMQRSRVGSPPESIHTTLSGTLSARRGGLPLASRAATATQRIDDLLQAALSPDAERSSTLVRDDDDGSAFFEDGGFGGSYYEDPPVPRPVSPQRYDESSAAEQRSPDATASSSFRRGTFFGTYAGSSDAAGTLMESSSPHAGKRRTFGDSMSAKLSNTMARTSPPRGGGGRLRRPSDGSPTRTGAGSGGGPWAGGSRVASTAARPVHVSRHGSITIGGLGQPQSLSEQESVVSITSGRMAVPIAASPSSAFAARPSAAFRIGADDGGAAALARFDAARSSDELVAALRGASARVQKAVDDGRRSGRIRAAVGRLQSALVSSATMLPLLRAKYASLERDSLGFEWDDRVEEAARALLEAQRAAQIVTAHAPIVASPNHYEKSLMPTRDEQSARVARGIDTQRRRWVNEQLLSPHTRGYAPLNTPFQQSTTTRGPIEFPAEEALPVGGPPPSRSSGRVTPAGSFSQRRQARAEVAQRRVADAERRQRSKAVDASIATRSGSSPGAGARSPAPARRSPARAAAESAARRERTSLYSGRRRGGGGQRRGRIAAMEGAANTSSTVETAATLLSPVANAAETATLLAAAKAGNTPLRWAMSAEEDAAFSIAQVKKGAAAEVEARRLRVLAKSAEVERKRAAKMAARLEASLDIGREGSTSAKVDSHRTASAMRHRDSPRLRAQRRSEMKKYGYTPMPSPAPTPKTTRSLGSPAARRNNVSSKTAIVSPTKERESGWNSNFVNAAPLSTKTSAKISPPSRLFRRPSPQGASTSATRSHRRTVPASAKLPSGAKTALAHVLTESPKFPVAVPHFVGSGGELGGDAPLPVSSEVKESAAAAAARIEAAAFARGSVRLEEARMEALLSARRRAEAAEAGVALLGVLDAVVADHRGVAGPKLRNMAVALVETSELSDAKPTFELRVYNGVPDLRRIDAQASTSSRSGGDLCYCVALHATCGVRIISSPSKSSEPLPLSRTTSAVPRDYAIVLASRGESGAAKPTSLWLFAATEAERQRWVQRIQAAVAMPTSVPANGPPSAAQRGDGDGVGTLKYATSSPSNIAADEVPPPPATPPAPPRGLARPGTSSLPSWLEGRSDHGELTAVQANVAAASFANSSTARYSPPRPPIAAHDSGVDAALAVLESQATAESWEEQLQSARELIDVTTQFRRSDREYVDRSIDSLRAEALAVVAAESSDANLQEFAAIKALANQLEAAGKGVDVDVSEKSTARTSALLEQVLSPELVRALRAAPGDISSDGADTTGVLTSRERFVAAFDQNETSASNSEGHEDGESCSRGMDDAAAALAESAGEAAARSGSGMVAVRCFCAFIAVEADEIDLVEGREYFVQSLVLEDEWWRGRAATSADFVHEDDSESAQNFDPSTGEARWGFFPANHVDVVGVYAPQEGPALLPSTDNAAAFTAVVQDSQLPDGFRESARSSSSGDVDDVASPTGSIGSGNASFANFAALEGLLLFLEDAGLSGLEGSQVDAIQKEVSSAAAFALLTEEDVREIGARASLTIEQRRRLINASGQAAAAAAAATPPRAAAMGRRESRAAMIAALLDQEQHDDEVLENDEHRRSSRSLKSTKSLKEIFIQDAMALTPPPPLSDEGDGYSEEDDGDDDLLPPAPLLPRTSSFVDMVASTPTSRSGYVMGNVPATNLSLDSAAVMEAHPLVKGGHIAVLQARHRGKVHRRRVKEDAEAALAAAEQEAIAKEAEAESRSKAEEEEAKATALAAALEAERDEVMKHRAAVALQASHRRRLGARRHASTLAEEAKRVEAEDALAAEIAAEAARHAAAERKVKEDLAEKLQYLNAAAKLQAHARRRASSRHVTSLRAAKVKATTHHSAASMLQSHTRRRVSQKHVESLRKERIEEETRALVDAAMLPRLPEEEKRRRGSALPVKSRRTSQLPTTPQIDGDEKSMSKKVLKWVRQVAGGKDASGGAIFPKADPKSWNSKRWESGHTLCAVVSAAVGPRRLDYDELCGSNTSSTSIEIITEAFGAAEEELGVPQLLEAEDVGLDVKSLQTYIFVLWRQAHRRIMARNEAMSKFPGEWVGVTAAALSIPGTIEAELHDSIDVAGDGEEEDGEEESAAREVETRAAATTKKLTWREKEALKKDADSSSKSETSAHAEGTNVSVSALIRQSKMKKKKSKKKERSAEGGDARDERKKKKKAGLKKARKVLKTKRVYCKTCGDMLSSVKDADARKNAEGVCWHAACFPKGEIAVDEPVFTASSSGDGEEGDGDETRGKVMKVKKKKKKKKKQKKNAGSASDSNPETKKKMSIEERTAEMKEKKRLAKVAKMKAKEVDAAADAKAAAADTKAAQKVAASAMLEAAAAAENKKVKAADAAAAASAAAADKLAEEEKLVSAAKAAEAEADAKVAAIAVEAEVATVAVAVAVGAAADAVTAEAEALETAASEAVAVDAAEAHAEVAEAAALVADAAAKEETQLAAAAADDAVIKAAAAAEAEAKVDAEKATLAKADIFHKKSALQAEKAAEAAAKEAAVAAEAAKVKAADEEQLRITAALAAEVARVEAKAARDAAAAEELAQKKADEEALEAEAVALEAAAKVEAEEALRVEAVQKKKAADAAAAAAHSAAEQEEAARLAAENDAIEKEAAALEAAAIAEAEAAVRVAAETAAAAAAADLATKVQAEAEAKAAAEAAHAAAAAAEEEKEALIKVEAEAKEKAAAALAAAEAEAEARTKAVADAAAAAEAEAKEKADAALAAAEAEAEASAKAEADAAAAEAAREKEEAAKAAAETAAKAEAEAAVAKAEADKSKADAAQVAEAEAKVKAKTKADALADSTPQKTPSAERSTTTPPSVPPNAPSDAPPPAPAAPAGEPLPFTAPGGASKGAATLAKAPVVIKPPPKPPGRTTTAVPPKEGKVKPAPPPSAPPASKPKPPPPLRHVAGVEIKTKPKPPPPPPGSRGAPKPAPPPPQRSAAAPTPNAPPGRKPSIIAPPGSNIRPPQSRTPPGEKKKVAPPRGPRPTSPQRVSPPAGPRPVSVSRGSKPAPPVKRKVNPPPPPPPPPGNPDEDDSDDFAC